MKQLLIKLMIVLCALTTSALFSHPDSNHTPKVFIRTIENDTDYPVTFSMKKKVIAKIAPHSTLPLSYGSIELPIDKSTGAILSESYTIPTITIANARTKAELYTWKFLRYIEYIQGIPNYFAEIWAGFPVREIQKYETPTHYGEKDNYNLEILLSGENLENTEFSIIPYLE